MGSVEVGGGRFNGDSSQCERDDLCGKYIIHAKRNENYRNYEKNRSI